MDQDQFIAVVRQSTGDDRESAEAAARATFRVLGERIGKDESRRLAAQLAPDIGAWLPAAEDPISFDAEEFVKRIGALLQSDRVVAERSAVAVLAALARAVPDEAYASLLPGLSNDYATLLTRSTFAGTVPLESFLARVAERARTDVTTAERATEAVLETLGERVTEGEISDLLGQLPLRLHQALKRGSEQADAASSRMPADEFVRRVGSRAGLAPLQALEYTRVVFATLRESFSDHEFFQVSVDLPGQYRVLLTAA